MGGVIARRLLPFALLVPGLVGWLQLRGEQAGLYGMQYGVILSVLANMTVFMLVVMWCAVALNHLDAKRTVCEEALQRSERQFRALVENSNDAITLNSVDGTIHYTSPAVQRVLGYSAAELTGVSAFSLIHPEDLKSVQERVGDGLRVAGTVATKETRVRHKDGSWRWVEVTGANLLADPRVGAIVCNVRDITERKKADEAIANYTERLRILHQIDRALIAGEGPAAIAAAALPPLRELLGVPRAIVNLFDLAKGEVEWLAAAGRHRVHIGPGVRYSIRLMGDVEALRRGEPQLIDVHALPPSPEVEALLASGVHTYLVLPMIAGDELIGALSFGGAPGPFSTQQISIAREAATQFAIALAHARLHECVKRQAQELELRVLERTRELEVAHTDLQSTNADLLKLTDELKAANKELDAFSYSISHDLRAPLRAIDGFSRILLEEYAAQLPEDGRIYLQDVRTNTRQMGHLVDDLLAFSRLSRQQVRKQAIDSTKLVQQCLEELRQGQDERRVEIRVGELPPCQADPALLKQVWINLLGNALKYTGKRESAVIEVGSRSDEDWPIYFVKDNGVGFDMRYAHKLFGVFQRLHRAEEYEGTGVGLAIVQRIVQRHGGKIWAEAEPDQGATFCFTLEGGPLHA